MTAQKIDGNALSQKLRAEVTLRTTALKAKGITPGFQRSGSQCDICSQFLGEGIAVYSLGSHGLLGFKVGEMIFSSKNAREFEFHGRYDGPA